MFQRDEIEALLEEHLRVESIASASRDGLRRFMAFIGRGTPTVAPEYVRDAIAPLGVGGPEVENEIAAVLEHAVAAGLDLEHAIPVTQAYVRALGRIVEAEVAHLHALLGDVEEERRIEVLGRVLPELVYAATRGFDALHRAFLRQALADELALPDEALDQVELTVALVDLSGSTRYLEHASPAETETLVDGLFEAGQGAAMGRAVRVVKYVGDGFFLAGRQPLEVVEASLHAVAQIDASLPLPARAGVACGPVVRRAGDLFGLPVNLAQLLTKGTEPRTVIVSGAVAAGLPPEMLGDRHPVAVMQGRVPQDAIHVHARA